MNNMAPSFDNGSCRRNSNLRGNGTVLYGNRSPSLLLIPYFPSIFIPVPSVLAWVSLILVEVRDWGRGRYYRQHDPALAALREKYAKGEITKDQLNQMTGYPES